MFNIKRAMTKEGDHKGRPYADGVFYCGIVLGDAFSKITSGHTKSVVSKTTLAQDNPTPKAEARIR